MAKSDLVDLDVQLHHQTQKALLVSLDGDQENAVWLPMSHVEYVYDNKRRVHVVTLPEWLAIDKGLV